MPTYDTIILGLGGMGSAAAFHLARRGQRVLGLEQFNLAHDRGSSHGHTRIIRKAYFEHPAYVPLLHQAYKGWAELETLSGHQLYHRIGLLMVGRPDGVVVPGVRRSAAEYQLEIEDVPIRELTRRFPGFLPGESTEALFEADAGFLLVEDCVRTYCEQAAAQGATLLTNQTLRSWSADARGVTVKTDSETHRAANLVFCGGAWTTSLLADLKLPLQIRRKPVFWFAARDEAYRLEHNCPVFCYDLREGFFYGFPVIDAQGFKVAEHTGGAAVARPDQLDRSLRPNEESAVRDFLVKHLPGVGPELKQYSICMYTMTPDEHFIIDRHRDHANVVYAACCSGHGFKFAPVVGSVLADLVIDGRTREPIEFLAASRPAIAGTTA